MHPSCEDGWEGEINQRRVIRPVCRGLYLEPASVSVLPSGDSRSAGGVRVVRPMGVFGVGLPDCSLGVFPTLGAQSWLWSLGVHTELLWDAGLPAVDSAGDLRPSSQAPEQRWGLGAAGWGQRQLECQPCLCLRCAGSITQQCIPRS